MAAWNEGEYDVLFRAHPPTNAAAPSPGQCAAIARSLRTHSSAAILSQWQDGRSIVLGHTGAASRRLRDYIARRGWT
jgi:hypothetical protein